MNRRRMLLSGGGNPFPEYTYTGSSQFIDDGDGNWRIKFLTSGNFTLLNKNFDVDIFLVGGGGGGGANGAGGGGGGYTKTVKNISIAKSSIYSVTIGAGGAGSTSLGSSYKAANGGASAFSNYTVSGGYGAYSANSGNVATSAGANGGSGGGGCGFANSEGHSGNGGTDGSNGGAGYGGAGSGQGSTTREFGEISGIPYSGGGGGGASYNNPGGSGRGGYYGGGNGANGRYYDSDLDEYIEARDGRNGYANSGGGGGGGGRRYSSSYMGVGGAGGSGIVIIRNARG